jgi:stage V sporulation protein SpoVS
MDERYELRCKTSTDAKRLSGSIHGLWKKDPTTPIVIRVIGAGALNQAVKGVILANKFFIKTGIVLGIQPSFQTSEDGVTAIDLRIIYHRV